jgi:Na+-driven multidrug efflux pump
VFIFFGGYMARWLSADPRIADLTARCLFITGFIQCSFAASAVFSGALRGAGDTLAVMLINLASACGIRFLGVVIVGRYLHVGLPGIWIVLSGELFCRGVFMYGRFLHGGWKTIKV